MNSAGGTGVAATRMPSSGRIPAASVVRLLAILLALALLAIPASARRYRRRSARRIAHRHVIRRRTSRRHVVHRAPRAARPPAAEPVHSVVILVADGFSGSDWDKVRASRPDGFTAWDRLPFSCSAIMPKEAGPNANSFVQLLSVGAEGIADPPPVTLLERAKATGKSVALVSSGAISDPIPAFLAVAANQEADSETLRRLIAMRFDALFGRSAPTDLTPAPSTVGYHVLTEPQAILMAEAVPALATASADAVPFDTMAFRALHLAARNPRGFVMAVGATSATSKPEEFNAVVSTALGYERRAGRTLVLVVLHAADGSTAVFADGQEAGKFRGSLLMSDIPKILGGVAGIRGMGRNFSPLFEALSAKPVARGGKGIVPLPW